MFFIKIVNNINLTQSLLTSFLIRQDKQFTSIAWDDKVYMYVCMY